MIIIIIIVIIIIIINTVFMRLDAHLTSECNNLFGRKVIIKCDVDLKITHTSFVILMWMEMLWAFMRMDTVLSYC